MQPPARSKSAFITLRVKAEYLYSAAIGSAQAADALDSGCLAGTVRPNHTEDLSFKNFERNVIHGNDRTVYFTQLLDFNHVWQILRRF